MVRYCFLVAAANALGWLGAFFIAYGLIASTVGTEWLPLGERIAERLSSGLTVFGTGLTASSIYFFSSSARPPDRVSRLVNAPIVIGSCVIALLVLIWFQITPVTVNGFALLGIAGGIFRLSPGPEV